MNESIGCAEKFNLKRMWTNYVRRKINLKRLWIYTNLNLEKFLITYLKISSKTSLFINIKLKRMIKNYVKI